MYIHLLSKRKVFASQSILAKTLHRVSGYFYWRGLHLSRVYAVWIRHLLSLAKSAAGRAGGKLS